MANYIYILTESKFNVVKDKPVISKILKMSMFLCREKSFTFSVSLGLFTVGAFESIKNFENLHLLMKEHQFPNFQKRGKLREV